MSELDGQRAGDHPQERIRQMALHEDRSPGSSFNRENSLREFDRARYPDNCSQSDLLAARLLGQFHIGHRISEYYAVLTEYLLQRALYF